MPGEGRDPCRHSAPVSRWTQASGVTWDCPVSSRQGHPCIPGPAVVLCPHGRGHGPCIREERPGSFTLSQWAPGGLVRNEGLRRWELQPPASLGHRGSQKRARVLPADPQEPSVGTAKWHRPTHRRLFRWEPCRCSGAQGGGGWRQLGMASVGLETHIPCWKASPTRMRDRGRESQDPVHRPLRGSAGRVPGGLSPGLLQANPRLTCFCSGALRVQWRQGPQTWAQGWVECRGEVQGENSNHHSPARAVQPNDQGQ